MRIYTYVFTPPHSVPDSRRLLGVPHVVLASKALRQLKHRRLEHLALCAQINRVYVKAPCAEVVDSHALRARAVALLAVRHVAQKYPKVQVVFGSNNDFDVGSWCASSRGLCVV